jgi:NAD(P)H-dependent flavin oxidoreductase YrpB (nitropropane dioxygenase family)
MTALLERLGVELPVVQAGMGGGIARHELAAAVSEAGGLGTLGTLPPDQLGAEIDAARRLTSAPIAVNLLLPFARRAHREIAARADAVVSFWGKPRRPSGGVWLHQCGSVGEAAAAHAAGADAVIAQGVEAGGHVRGKMPALELLERIRDALPDGYPVLLAGGIAEGADVRRALEAGAEAAVSGTAFLLSEESRAHPEYKRRVIDAGSTQLTELFGLGWPAAPHRVVPNGATRRWTASDTRGPGWVRGINRALSPLASRSPGRVQSFLAGRQAPGLPLLSPQPPTDDGPANLIECGPLYAGETALRLSEERPASEVVRSLSEGNRL